MPWPPLTHACMITAQLQNRLGAAKLLLQNLACFCNQSPGGTHQPSNLLNRHCCLISSTKHSM